MYSGYRLLKKIVIGGNPNSCSLKRLNVDTNPVAKSCLAKEKLQLKITIGFMESISLKSPSELNKYNSLRGILSFKVNLSWPSLFLYAKRMPIANCFSRSPSTRKSWIGMQPTVLNLHSEMPYLLPETNMEARGHYVLAGRKGDLNESGLPSSRKLSPGFKMTWGAWCVRAGYRMWRKD